MRELEILEDFKTMELQKWVSGKQVLFSELGIDKKDLELAEDGEEIDMNKILNGVELVWERGCRRWKGRKLVTEILYLESIQVRKMSIESILVD